MQKRGALLQEIEGERTKRKGEERKWKRQKIRERKKEKREGKERQCTRIFQQKGNDEKRKECGKKYLYRETEQEEERKHGWFNKRRTAMGASGEGRKE